MSIEQKNLSCSLCHSYLFQEDDVVYCPVCGAPHHRECYNSIGHCALEQTHGTDMQYDKLKQKQQEEQEKNPPNEEPKTDGQGGFNPPFNSPIYFDLLGGVPKEQLIDEDVTAEDAAKFVFSNTMRYIPKFAKLGRQSKISWNFLAFLFPCGWFLSRKMYKNGLIVGFLNVISSLLSIPLQKVILNLGVMETGSYLEMTQKVMANIGNISPAVIYIAFIGMWIGLAVSLFSALFGDYLYKCHTVNTVRQLKKTSDDFENDCRKKGGVSLLLFFVGAFAVRYIPAIISTLI